MTNNNDTTKPVSMFHASLIADKPADRKKKEDIVDDITTYSIIDVILCMLFG